MTAHPSFPGDSEAHCLVCHPVYSNEESQEPLGGGILALALIAGITTLATITMAATTSLALPWPEIAFRGLAAAMVAAVIFAVVRKFSSVSATFTLGVIMGIIPSLWIASHHEINHWDDFMTWLGNALYILEHGGFPTAALPPIASVWPGYPPGSSIVIAAVWSVAGRAVETVGPIFNVVCLAIIPGLILRAVGKKLNDGLSSVALGAALALAATLLNVGLDWHWVLSSLPETAMLVAFAAAFVLAAEMRLLNDRFSYSHLAALAAILALITNLKQTGIVLVALLILATLLVTWTWIEEDEVHWFKRPIWRLTLVCAPCLAVWLSWQLYRVNFFPGFAFTFRPFDEWNPAALMDLLSSIGGCVYEQILFFVPVTAVVLRGWYLLGRRWLAGDRVMVSEIDRMAALFALVESGYLSFLIVCYLGAFTEPEARGAVEFFRYQSTLGAAGLIVALALIWERRPQTLQTSAVIPVFAVQLVIAAAILPAAGIYHGKGVYDQAEIAQLREIGRKTGEVISRTGEEVRVQLPHNDGQFAVLIVRYDIWASAPLLIRGVVGDWAGNELADRFLKVRRYAHHALALENLNGIHCAVLSHQNQLAIIGAAADLPNCLPLITRLRRIDERVTSDRYPDLFRGRMEDALAASQSINNIP